MADRLADELRRLTLAFRMPDEEPAPADAGPLFDELLDRCWDAGTVPMWGHTAWGGWWVRFQNPRGTWDEACTSSLERGARLLLITLTCARADAIADLADIARRYGLHVRSERPTERE
jgi:hypothetical protein